MVSVEDYCEQKDNIVFDGEIYSVRDNGAVFRYSKGNKPRKYDNFWTFGKQNSKGYMEIAGARIHRIVATAFLGNPPTPQHIVDHIDTNRANNRPNNLRWLTKLENTLLNPITAKKIVSICGSIENFLNDPHKYFDKLTDQNVSWMRTVSKEEAANCLEHFLEWTKTDNDEEYDYEKSKGIGEWIFNRKTIKNIPKEHRIIVADEMVKHMLEENRGIYRDNAKLSLFKISNTEHCVQDWQTPTAFLCCPKTITDTPLLDYFNNLKIGAIFSKNSFSEMYIVKYALCDGFIAIMHENRDPGAVKPLGLSKIVFEDGVFYHYNKHNFFTDEGAEKYFTLLQGREWAGGDTFDDFC